jgi:hypothetical protein
MQSDIFAALQSMDPAASATGTTSSFLSSLGMRTQGPTATANVNTGPSAEDLLNMDGNCFFFFFQNFSFRIFSLSSSCFVVFASLGSEHGPLVTAKRVRCH